MSIAVQTKQAVGFRVHNMWEVMKLKQHLKQDVRYREHIKKTANGSEQCACNAVNQEVLEEAE